METATADPTANGTTDPVEHDDAPQDSTLSAELVIDGTGQLSMAVGGKRPTNSTLRLTGGKTEVEGQFEKGEIVKVEITAVVGEVAFRDDVDGKTGQVVGCARNHKARIAGVRLLES